MSGTARWLHARWYEGAGVPWWLAVLEAAFVAVSGMRRWLYRHRVFRSGHPGVPVVVVGNLVAGGSGKTPLVIALVRILVQAGRRPGVVSRGYGRRARGLHVVGPASDADHAGDEPIEIYRATGVPVAVARDRLQAARALVEHAGVDCIVADDGLQHYRLRRDIEIVSVDGERGLGNRRCLPAGPLREAPARLQTVDLVLTRNGSDEHAWSLQAQGLRRVDDDAPLEPVQDWQGRAVNAVAGLAHPERFFETLRALGLDLRQTRALPDHHRFSAADLDFDEPLPVIMTGKDAAKCRDFARSGVRVLEVRAHLPESVGKWILERLEEAATE
ncbi:MAG TPA: tetraacyldisaccharide 4'-kinase [Xanthomonadaceae bacterium]|nr:tetraacyldisaccharide 4'-kinase [Xanthomonadaceae bacterium]